MNHYSKIALKQYIQSWTLLEIHTGQSILTQYTSHQHSSLDHRGKILPNYLIRYCNIQIIVRINSTGLVNSQFVQKSSLLHGNLYSSVVILERAEIFMIQTAVYHT